MTFLGILSAIGNIAPIAQPVLEWGIRGIVKHFKKRLDIAKAYNKYQAEFKLNYAILERIKLETINTRDITSPAVKGIVSRLKTQAAEALLEALLSHIQNPQKAVKALQPVTLARQTWMKQSNLSKI